LGECLFPKFEVETQDGKKVTGFGKIMQSGLGWLSKEEPKIF
jgi:hypothetical protein